MPTTNREATMSATINYQQETCGRCGGSGSYSFNLMHGSVCYGCSGRKVRLTKAGANAAAAVNAFIVENFTVPVASLNVGDRVRYDGVARTITAIEFQGGNQYGSLNNATGEMEWSGGVSITFNKPIKSQFGAFSTVGMANRQTSTLVKAVAGADWDRVVEFARTIKRGITIVEAAEKTEVAR